MTSGACKGERTKKHVHSEAQRRFFYSVASGKARKNTSMTPKQARHHIEMGKKQKGKLVARVIVRRAKRKRKRS